MMNNRLFLLHEFLQGKNLDAILLNTSEFLPSINLKYFSGFTGSEATILITPTERHLFTDGRYKIQAKQEARGFLIHVVRRKIDAVARVMEVRKVNRLGIEGSRISYDFVATLTRRLPNIRILPLARRFTENFRLRKTPEELAKIRKAAQIASVSCRKVLESGVSLKSESQVATELETLFRLNGADGVAFDTLVASGTRSALPHGKPSAKIISRGDLVIVDYGCRCEGYNSDETVTCITGGMPSSEQKSLYQAVYEAHMRAIDKVKVGLRVRELDYLARQSIDKAGFAKYFLHGLGHGIGMEVHEPPSISQRGRGVFEEGMVFTIEPGIYVDGIGGVRLESLVYLSESGPEVLSTMPKELISVS